MATKEAIRLRRQKVLALSLNKVSIDQIAQRLGWDRHTIWNDIVATRREYAKKELEGEDPVTDYLMTNAELYRKVAKIEREATDDNVRLRAIREMRELQKDRFEKLLITGIVDKKKPELPARKYIIQWETDPKEKMKEIVTDAEKRGEI
ncbi:MAG: hypothetical protein HY364_01615 [Candidatus Aenigmarchaeota archaeon]|nr:hypothetical protein [Candidatus Aenigmarchaeota archaeon]